MFADARQRFARNALDALASNFADPAVGAVTGELVLDCEAGSAAADSEVAEGVGLYWKYEKWLRRQESRVWSTLGATGAIYAIRRALWRPLPPETLLDDVLAPMRIVLNGKRVVFDDQARAFDRVSATGADESRRKTGPLLVTTRSSRSSRGSSFHSSTQSGSSTFPTKSDDSSCPGVLAVPSSPTSLLPSAAGRTRLALLVQLCFYGLAIFGGLLESRNRMAGSRAEELRRVASARSQGS